ncbi:hypothetical protein Tco_1142410 [Tanacetum coccineum]
MASNIKNFKCLIHFNETKRGSILSEDLTYSMLHEMVMQKFNLEANAEINFSFKLSSFDFAVDITDDAETIKEVFRDVYSNAIGLRAIQGKQIRVAVAMEWKTIRFSNCIWYMQRENRHAAIAMAVENEFPLAFHSE